ncbi:hypothetical protein CR513_05720, partial [Mucuna pruriens]
MDQSMIDAASRGALMDKMSEVARQLISNMASNTQQFGIRGANQSRMMNEISAVDNLRLENQLIEQLGVGQHQPSIIARVCGICPSVEHPIDMCPTLQETKLDHPESIGAIVGHLIINSLKSNHFDQGRVKGHMQLNDSDLPQMHLKDQHVINNRLHNIKYHRSNNNINREFHLKEIHHL